MNNIILLASHIAEKENVLADALSRGRVSQGKWSLSQSWVELVFQRLGRPLIDLFAKEVNAKLPTFCSWSFHPHAWAIDALSLSWDGLD